MFDSTMFAMRKWPAPRRQILSMTRAALLAASGVVSLSGCGVYLHDARLATSTSEMKQSFEKIEAPAMMAGLKERHKEFSQAEDQATAEYGVAARNAAVISFVRARAGGSSGIQDLRAFVEEDLGTVFGNASDEELDRLIAAPSLAQDFIVQQRSLNESYATTAADFLAARDAANAQNPGAPPDKRSVDCKAFPAGRPLDLPATAAMLEKRYNLVWQDCYAKAQLALLSSQGTAPRNGSQLAEARNALATAYEQRDVAQVQATTIKGNLDKLLKEEAPPTSVEALNNEIERISRQLETAAPIVRAAGYQTLADRLGEITAAALAADNSEATGSTETRTAAVLAFGKAVANLNDVLSGRVDRTNELLLAAARIRHELNMAQADAAREDARIGILEAQLVALQNKASSLARAKRIIDLPGFPVRGDLVSLDKKTSGYRASSEALAAYLESWNSGEIPYRILQLKEVQVSRGAALEKAALTEADYRAVLKPAFDQMAAYGEGGIKPETIVDVLGHLGVASALLGD
jgi:hypothetical protein